MSYPARRYSTRRAPPPNYYHRRPAYARPAYVKRAAPARAAPKRRSKYTPVYRAVGSALPLLGGGIGGAIGGPAGTAIGASAGKLGQSILKGFGDYTINQNTLLSGELPQMSNSTRSGGGVIISFKEYIGDVVSNVSANTFDLQSYNINPTSEKSFPWLSQMAGNFQEWIPHGIVFQYKSMSGNALDSVNTSLGNVILATNYNSSLPNFGSKAEMENTEFSNSIKPSMDCLHMIECAKSASVIGNLYTQSPSTDDIRFSSLGNFQVATNAVQGQEVNLGELWVTYTIELLRPKLSDALGNDVQVLWLSMDGCTDALPLGTRFDKHTSSNINVISPTSSTFTFPHVSVDKSYMIQLLWNGTSVAVQILPSIIPSDGASEVDDMYVHEGGSLQNSATGQVAVTGTRLTYNACYNVKGGSDAAILTFGNGGTLPLGDCRCDFKVIEIPNSFVTSPGVQNDFLESQ